MNPTRLLVADDHALVRAGIRAFLERIPNIEVVAEASDGREVVELVAKQQPDIVLMDIAMPGLNGLEATRQIVKLWPDVRVIVLSMHASEEYVWQALRAGARGYLLKGASLARRDGERQLRRPTWRNCARALGHHMIRCGAALRAKVVVHG